MGKSPRKHGRRIGIKTSTESNNPLSKSGGYKAHIVGYEDVLYSYGTTNATAMFGMVKVKLVRYVSVQSWSGVMLVGNAMQKLARPTLTIPKLPSLTKEYEELED